MGGEHSSGCFPRRRERRSCNDVSKTPIRMISRFPNRTNRVVGTESLFPPARSSFVASTPILAQEDRDIPLAVFS